MGFPAHRMRRLRATAGLRRLVRETTLSVDDLVLPLFVRPGRGVRRPIEAMSGCFQLSVDELVVECREVTSLGIPAVILFGIPETKDATGSSGCAPDGIVQTALRALKDEGLDLVLITDVCLCEYTDHGHCGLLRREQPQRRRGTEMDDERSPKGEELPESGAAADPARPCSSPLPLEARDVVDNDATLEALGRMALSHAEAGADMVAPSDMMDGRVAAIRRALDGAGHETVPILAYAAKFASAFYGPFREAAESTPAFGDRRGYQMDPPNAREALREIQLDIDEGADIVMVKPALAYLDVLARARERFDVPLCAYNVSGEYAMLKAAAERGWLDEKAVALEALTAIKRAGASFILTYWAKDVARWLG